jgi:hypothetical protein
MMIGIAYKRELKQENVDLLLRLFDLPEDELKRLLESVLIERGEDGIRDWIREARRSATGRKGRWNSEVIL